jgi:hypothetical protein
MNSKIEQYEKEFKNFKPIKHFENRIENMKNHSAYGKKLAKKWTKILDDEVVNQTYPVVHPIGQETFSLFAEFPSGVFEYTLAIDRATKLIKDRNIQPTVFYPTDIIEAVDQGNINKDLSEIKTNHKNPVMVLQSHYLTEAKPYCINGNHRINEAYKNSDVQIEVYVFQELEFISFFYDYLSQAMYYLEIDYYNVVNNKRYLLHNEGNSFAERLD